MRSKAACGAAIGAACLFAAGCGSSATQQVRAKVQQFAVAIVHRNARTICTEVFASSLVKRFASAGLSCERGLEIFFSGLRHPTLAVGRVTVHGSKASAMTLSGASGQTASLRPVELVETSGGWRIAALGAPVKPGSRTGTTTARGSSATTARGSGPTTARSSGTTTARGSGATTARGSGATIQRAQTETTRRPAVKHPPAKKGSTPTKP